MDTHSINSAVINGTGFAGRIAYIPGAATTLETILYEHLSPYLEASAGISFGTIADITRLAQPGTIDEGIEFVVSGSLSLLRNINLGAVASGFTFGQTGAVLTKGMQLAPVDASLDVVASGTLLLVAAIAGKSAIAVEATAQTPHIYSLMMGSAAGVEFVATAEPLTLTVQLPVATAGVAVTASASLFRHVGVNLGSATAGVRFGSTADLMVYRGVEIGPVASGIAITATADIARYRFAWIGPASTSMNFYELADLTRFGKVHMEAQEDMRFDVLGDLTRHSFVHLAASDGMQFDASGQLGGFIRVRGDAALTINQKASLYNNPLAYDPPQNMLARPAVNRTVSR